jgi:uncharacterized paraquat-inducible protein A
MSEIPNLTGNSGIQIKKKLSYILTCPKCTGDIDVTDIKSKTHISCGKCENVTWRPDYNPPWWAKTRNFIFALISALVIGIISAWIVGIVFEQSNSDLNKTEKNINELKENKNGN